jgi:hypothetical protein
MSVETEATAAAETTETTNDFTATLAAAMERGEAAPVEEEVVEEAEPTEGEEAEQPAETPAAAVVEPPKEEPKPTAPTLAPEWISEAVRLNVPRELLKFAKTNDDVQQMIVEFGDQPEPEAAPAAEFPIAADDFDATDPVHRALKLIWEENQQLRGDLGKVTQSTTGLITERQQAAILAKEAEYDAGMDALNIPELGNRGSDARKQAWAAYEFFLERNPGVSKAELAKRAAYATHPHLITKQATSAQLEAIAGNQQRTLGAGPSKPPATKPPTPKDQFLAKLDAADRSARKRLQEAG